MNWRPRSPSWRRAARRARLRALTLRELHTLSLIADGKSYGAIADELHVSYKTVANTASLIKTKLNAKSLPELMRIAIAHLPSETGRRSL